MCGRAREWVTLACAGSVCVAVQIGAESISATASVCSVCCTVHFCIRACVESAARKTKKTQHDSTLISVCFTCLTPCACCMLQLMHAHRGRGVYAHEKVSLIDLQLPVCFVCFVWLECERDGVCGEPCESLGRSCCYTSNILFDLRSFSLSSMSNHSLSSSLNPLLIVSQLFFPPGCGSFFFRWCHLLAFVFLRPR